MTQLQSASATWTSALAGVVLIAVSIPLILKRIPPNPVYGFRTFKTLSSPEIWYAANSVAGKDFLMAGMVIIVYNLALALMPGAFPVWLETPLANTGVLVLAATVALIHSFWMLGKM